MRELPLFSAVETSRPKQRNSPSPDEKAATKMAKDFVRWCFSLGNSFRNSPDVVNLRFWARQKKLKLKPHTEARLLEDSQRLFTERLEQSLKR